MTPSGAKSETPFTLNKGGVMRYLLIVLAFAAVVFAAEDLASQIAMDRIKVLTVQLDKADRAGNKRKVRYILAQLETQAKVIALGNLEKKGQ